MVRKAYPIFLGISSDESRNVFKRRRTPEGTDLGISTDRDENSYELRSFDVLGDDTCTKTAGRMVQHS